MRGGSVIVAAGNYGITVDQFGGGLGLQPLAGGLQELLASYGVEVGPELVMDLQNEAFPVPVIRDVGGFQVQEIQARSYPFFVDIRSDGMASGSPIVSNLPAVTLNWASPITIDEDLNAEREVVVLLQSSLDSWITADTNIQPNPSLPEPGFLVMPDDERHTLAVSIQGSFDSFYRDQASPFAAGALDEGPDAVPGPAVIESSPNTARLIVFGSAEFVDDLVFEISASLTYDRYLNSIKLVQNAIAWATEDLDLLSIRSRGTQVRVLNPMEEGDESFWEGANYVLALASLVTIGFVWSARRRNEEPILQDAGTKQPAE
jgi:ABC-2 type transport system permease protein